MWLVRIAEAVRNSRDRIASLREGNRCEAHPQLPQLFSYAAAVPSAHTSREVDRMHARALSYIGNAQSGMP